MRQETFATPHELNLSIRCPTGEIELETYEGTETQVDLRVRGDDEGVRELLAETLIQLRERGDGHELLVEVPRVRGGGGGFFFRRDPEIALRVRCPHGTSADIRTKSADLEGVGRFGRIEAITTSGDVRFDDVSQDAIIHSTSGDVSIERVGGTLEVRTTSGDVHLGRAAGAANIALTSGDLVVRDAAGSLTANAVSGDLDVKAVVEGDVRLQSVSGDVRVGIRRGSRLWVDAKTMSGSTRSELELGDDPVESDGPLVELRVNTVSGDVLVQRAASAPAEAAA